MINFSARYASVASLFTCVVFTLASMKTSAQPTEPNEAPRDAGRQDAAEPPPGYEPAIKLALREFELGNYPEARTRLIEAHRLFPNARTLRALGMVEYELRNYGAAITQLEAALNVPVRRLEGEMRLETESLLAQARGYVATVVLDIDPESTSVTIDGVPVAMPKGHTLLLQIGDHRLVFGAPSRGTEVRTLHVKGGEVERLRVTLPPVKVETHEVEHRPLRRNPWLWTAFGVLVVGAAAGTAIALTRDRSRGGTAQAYGGNSNAVLTVP